MSHTGRQWGASIQSAVERLETNHQGAVERDIRLHFDELRAALDHREAELLRQSRLVDKPVLTLPEELRGRILEHGRVSAGSEVRRWGDAVVRGQKHYQFGNRIGDEVGAGEGGAPIASAVGGARSEESSHMRRSDASSSDEGGERRSLSLSLSPLPGAGIRVESREELLRKWYQSNAEE